VRTERAVGAEAGILAVMAGGGAEGFATAPAAVRSARPSLMSARTAPGRRGYQAGQPARGREVNSTRCMMVHGLAVCCGGCCALYWAC